MKTSRNGVKLIIAFEGKHRKLPDGRYQAYKCPADVWTIYAGTTEGVHEGMVVTAAEGEAFFRRDLAKFEAAVNSQVKVDINQNQFDALVSLAYNIGEGAAGDPKRRGLINSSVLRALNKGDYAGAEKAFGQYVNAAGKRSPGLVRRRKQEAALFAKPVTEPDAEPHMPQAVDPPPPPVVATAATLYQSRSLWAQIAATASVIFGLITDWARTAWDALMCLVGIFPEVQDQTRQALSSVQEVAGWFSLNIEKIAGVVAAVCIVVAMVRHAHLRIEAKS